MIRRTFALVVTVALLGAACSTSSSSQSGGSASNPSGRMLHDHLSTYARSLTRLAKTKTNAEFLMSMNMK